MGCLDTMVFYKGEVQLVYSHSLRKNLMMSNLINKYLNGTLESVVSECKLVDLPDEIRQAAKALKPKAKETKHVNGRIVGADIIISLVCMNCKKRMEGLDDANRFID